MTRSESGLRVIVIGATGNVGTALIRRLSLDPLIGSIVGVARRLPGPALLESAAGNDRVRWQAADIASSSLDFVRGADVVVHLAWRIQPSRDEAALLETNVRGTQRVIDAIVRHGVPALVYASSVGTYAPGPKSETTDEHWPTTGIPTSTYSRHKARVEDLLDDAEGRYPSLRVVRLRTSLVFQRSAAAEVHRIFMGRLLPWHLPKVLRLVPRTERLVFQATHADDIADAYWRAITMDVRGAFNIAAEPVLTPAVIATAVGGRTLPVPTPLLRVAAQLTFAARLQPTEPGWIDLATQTPIMDTTRARTVLGWQPTRSSTDALAELLDGIGDGAGGATLPLHPRSRPPAG